MHLNKSIKYIDINLIILKMPGYAYWKDLNSIYRGCNYNMAKVCGCDSPDKVIGKSDYDFAWGGDLADKFREDDLKVINHNSSVVNIYELPINNEIKTYRTEKNPLIDENGNVFGILGIAVDITAEIENEELRIKDIENQAKIKINNTLIACLEDIHHTIESYKLDVLNDKLSSFNQNPSQNNTTSKQTIKLTKREREIIYFLSLNKTSKEIAQILSVLENKSLSPSTIVSIIDKKLYVKFGVNNIAGLVEIANKLKLIPFVLN